MKFTTQEVYKYVNDAKLLYETLNGVFLLYKPTSIAFQQMRGTLISNLCRDLNNMCVRPPNKHVTIKGSTNKDMNVVVHDSYADNILVAGPRYQMQDFRLAATKIFHRDVCGVVVCGVNYGNSLIQKMRTSKITRFYKVKGLLGKATHNYFRTGRVMEKSTYNHVTRDFIDNVCSSMQSAHQRKMFELCGVDIQSQAAYNLAVQGLLRPANSKIPMIYVIKCIDFSPPEFTLEIVCTNEYDMYLKTIIHDIGMKLRSTATCTQINCIQDGLFNVDNALLSKHWTLNNIIESMRLCDRIISENKYLISQENPTLVEQPTSTTVPLEQKSLI